MEGDEWTGDVVGGGNLQEKGNGALQGRGRERVPGEGRVVERT